MFEALMNLTGLLCVGGTIAAYGLIFVAARDPAAHFEYRWKTKEEEEQP